MILKEIIAILEDEDPENIIPIGFDSPHSYRGSYDKLAFEPSRRITVKKMLANAKKAVNSKYSGYKGGTYKITKNTKVYLANYGKQGVPFTEGMLRNMLKPV